MAVQPVAKSRHLVAFILEIILLARCSQGLSRSDAFIGYSEKPGMFKKELSSHIAKLERQVTQICDVADPEVVVLSTAPGEVVGKDCGNSAVFWGG